MKINARRLRLFATSLTLAALALVAVGIVLLQVGVQEVAADLEERQAVAAQKDVYVDDDGKDEEGCGTTVVSACQTIQYAIDEVAESGDTVIVLSGTYTENVTITESLTLRAGSAPVLDGAGIGGTGVSIDASDVSVTGFTIQNYTTGVEIKSGTDVSVLSNDIRDNTGSGILVWDNAAAGNLARFNTIVGNSVGITNEDSNDPFQAQDNWWGCNEGPSTVPGDCDAITVTVDANPWLILRLSANPTLVHVDGGTSVLTADLTFNSTPLDTSALGHIPDGTTTTFTTTLGTATPEVTGTVDGVARSTFGAGSVTGAAVVSATVDNETVTDTVNVEQVELAIGKTDGVKKVRPGDVLTYTLTITNDSDLDATGVVVTDTLPVSTTYVGGANWHQVGDVEVYTQSVGKLEAGGTMTFSISVVLTETVPAGFDVITNTAEVVDDGTQGPQAYAKIEDVDQVVIPPDLVVAKENGEEVVEPGQVLTYTLTVSNAGKQDAVGVTVTDTLSVYTTFITATQPSTFSGDHVTWGPFGLPVGDAVTRTVTVSVTNPLAWPAGVEVITNTATVSDDGSSGADLNPEDNIARDVDEVAAHPDLFISKTDNASTTTLGGSIVYTLLYRNQGTQDATGVVITETLPANTTFDAMESDPDWEQVGSTDVYTLSAGPLAVGAVDGAVFAVTVDDTLPEGVETIANVVHIGDDGTSGSDSDPDNNSDDDVDSVSAAPDLSIDKDSGSDSVKANETFTYTLTISNTGTQGATGVVVSDTLPPHTSFVTASHGASLSAGVVTWPSFPLAAPGSITRTLTLKVAGKIPVGVETITNTASVSDDGENGQDLDPLNNTVEDALLVDADPLLAISKDDGRETVAPGDVLIYTWTVTNTGTRDAATVVVTDTLPQHTTFIAASLGGTLEAGKVTWPAFALGVDEVETGTVTVRVAGTVPSGVSVITNTVVAVGDGGISAEDDDFDTVDAAPDLKVVKTDGRYGVAPGETLIYTLTVENKGTQGATGVVVSDTLPANTKFAGASDGGIEAGGVVTWPTFALGAGAAVTRRVTVTVVDPWPTGDVALLTNTASVTDDGANGDDLVPGNNIDTDTTHVWLHYIYLPLIAKH